MGEPLRPYSPLGSSTANLISLTIAAYGGTPLIVPMQDYSFGSADSMQLPGGGSSVGNAEWVFYQALQTIANPGSATAESFGTLPTGYVWGTSPSVTEMYGLTSGTHIRAATVIFSRMFADMFAEKGDMPQMRASWSTDDWFSDSGDDTMIPIEETLNETEFSLGYYPIATQAVMRAFIVAAAQNYTWEFTSAWDNNAKFTENGHRPSTVMNHK